MGALLPWRIFRAAFLMALIAANAAAFRFRQSPFSTIEMSVLYSRMCRSPFSTVPWLVCFEHIAMTCRGAVTAKAPASLAFIRGGLHYARPPADLMTIQPSSLYTNFLPLCTGVRKARTPRILRHATLPIRFPILDKSGDNGLRLLPHYAFARRLLKAAFLSPTNGK